MTLEDSVDIKPEVLGIVKRGIFQGVCDHYDTTVTDSKRHKSWIPTQERRMQDQSHAIYG